MEAVYRPAGETCHWYTVLGEPMWEVPYADRARGMRAPTLADARKLDLLPSVTTIIRGGRPQPYGVQSWLMDLFGQHLLTTPRWEEETDEAFLTRVAEEYEAARSAAPDLGTEVHGLIAQWLRGGATIEVGEDAPEGHRVALQAVQWIQHNITEVHAVEVPLARPDVGYAGTADALVTLASGAVVLIDWKTQYIKGTNPKAYDEWVIQLAACDQLVAATDLPAPEGWANVVIPTDPEHGEALYVPWKLEAYEWGLKAFDLALQTYRHTNRWGWSWPKEGVA